MFDIDELFIFSESRNTSEELNHPLSMTAMSALIMCFYGAVKGGQEAREEFLEKHQHTKWKSRIIAVVRCFVIFRSTLYCN